MVVPPPDGMIAAWTGTWTWTRSWWEPDFVWAGAETATRWNGYMDGAVRSGADAATAVLAR